MPHLNAQSMHPLAPGTGMAGQERGCAGHVAEGGEEGLEMKAETLACAECGGPPS